jgi:hypothetical protein
MSIRALKLAFAMKSKNNSPPHLMKKLINKFATDTVVPSSMPFPTTKPEEIGSGPVSQDSRPRKDKNGIQRFYNSFGKLHRMDGPAVISPDGNQLYYQNGILHREDGPAAIFHNGTQKWYMDGDEISPLEILQLKLSKGQMSIHDVDTLKELADIAFFDYAKTSVKALQQAGHLLHERNCLSTKNMHTIVAFLRAAQKL